MVQGLYFQVDWAIDCIAARYSRNWNKIDLSLSGVLEVCNESGLQEAWLFPLCGVSISLSHSEETCQWGYSSQQRPASYGSGLGFFSMQVEGLKGHLRPSIVYFLPHQQQTQWETDHVIRGNLIEITGVTIVRVCKSSLMLFNKTQ